MILGVIDDFDSERTCGGTAFEWAEDEVPDDLLEVGEFLGGDLDAADGVGRVLGLLVPDDEGDLLRVLAFRVVGDGFVPGGAVVRVADLRPSLRLSVNQHLDEGIRFGADELREEAFLRDEIGGLDDLDLDLAVEEGRRPGDGTVDVSHGDRWLLLILLLGELEGSFDGPFLPQLFGGDLQVRDVIIESRIFIPQRQEQA